MSTPRDDDDALRWEGDDDLTASPALPQGWRAVGKGSEAVPVTETTLPGHDDDRVSGPADDDAAVVPPGMSNAQLLGTGVIAGAYVLYVVGWLIAGLRLQTAGTPLIGAVAFQISLWLAVLAPVIWFGASFVLTRGAKAWTRFALLGAGLVALIPWPFIMTGVLG